MEDLRNKLRAKLVAQKNSRNNAEARLSIVQKDIKKRMPDVDETVINNLAKEFSTAKTQSKYADALKAINKAIENNSIDKKVSTDTREFDEKAILEMLAGEETLDLPNLTESMKTNNVLKKMKPVD